MCGVASSFRLLFVAGIVLRSGQTTAPNELQAAVCTELPKPGFPGETAQESAALWPSGKVPKLLECWPKNSSGGIDGACPQVAEELEDFEKGWPGQCSSLTEVSLPAGEASCESYCKKRTDCAVFQVTASKTCWLGLHGFPGTSCYTGSGHILESGKRLMHGGVRELASLEGVQIIGLQQGFDENYFINVYPDAVNACKHICYSNIFCRFWQYSLASGCWTEVGHPSGIEDPITRSSWRTHTPFAATVVAGSYIQRVCAGAQRQAALLPGMLAGVFGGNETLANASAAGAIEEYVGAIAEACRVPPHSIRNVTEDRRVNGYRFVLFLPEEKDKEAVRQRCDGEELTVLGGSASSAHVCLGACSEAALSSTTASPGVSEATGSTPHTVVRRKIPWWGWAILILVVAICLQSSFLGYFGIDRDVTFFVKQGNADERSGMMAISGGERTGLMGAEFRPSAPGSFTAIPPGQR